MAEIEEPLQCEHAEHVQDIILCDVLDCSLTGSHPARVARDSKKPIHTEWWCLNVCRLYHQRRTKQ
ncbi:MAG: hypothetical protein PUB69_05150 [Desulfovibrionaceae bacterium]|nr:hypothetical protein [Desulfovibrionaceae bacterium]